MVGRRALRWNGEASAQAGPPLCPLCERPIPASARQSRHHLTPKCKGGRETVLLHQICHSAIHACYDETEVARRLADIAALREDPEIARFLAWVRGKPPDFHAPTRTTRRRREERRLR